MLHLAAETERQRQKLRRQSTMPYLLLILCLSLLPGASGACLGAAECDCEVPPGQGRPLINCRYRQLTEVPSFQSSSLVFAELTLAGNYIRFVPDGAFRGLGLTRLDLTGNPLTNVSRLAFEGLEPVLQELLIQLDSTSEFPVDSIGRLVRLRLLRVVGYGQTSLPTGALVALVSLGVLELTNGQLRVLRPQDLSIQRNSLQTLNLEENRLTEVPTDALASLRNLTGLSLARNLLTRVRGGAFDGCRGLEHIDLSGNGLTDDLEAMAFRGLEGTLMDVTLVSCQLRDRSLEALRPIWAMRRLNLQNNDLADLPYEIFAAMTNLGVLNLDSNRLTAIHQNAFRGLTGALQTLHLGHNPIFFFASGALGPLKALRELHLDGLTFLRLNRESLSGQRGTLETLSLAQTPMGDYVWLVIAGLSALKVLDLSSIGVASIPDGAFRLSPGLQSIDISLNNITKIGRATFSGLEDSLSNVRLNSNQIATLDPCSFAGLRRLNYTRLGLMGNQLACDCRLKWLYLAAKAESSIRFSSLNWRCSSGELVTQLQENDLVCNSTASKTTVVPCPEILGVRGQTEAPAVTSLLKVTSAKVTPTEITVSWSPEGVIVDRIRCFTLTFEPLGKKVNGTRATTNISEHLRDYVLDDLRPDTAYEICVEMKLNEPITAGVPRVACTHTTTLPLSKAPGLGAIVGALFGAIAVLAIALLVGWLVTRRQLFVRSSWDADTETRGKAWTTEVKPGRMPRLGQNSKRFSRNCEFASPGFPERGPKSESRPHRPGDSEPRRLSEEDRARVMAMLQASLEDSVLRLTTGLTTYGDGRAFDNAAFDQEQEVFAAHVYEVIPEVNAEVNLPTRELFI